MTKEQNSPTDDPFWDQGSWELDPTSENNLVGRDPFVRDGETRDGPLPDGANLDSHADEADSGDHPDWEEEWERTVSVDNSPALWHEVEPQTEEGGWPTSVTDNTPAVDDGGAATRVAASADDPWHASSPPSDPTRTWEPHDWRLTKQTPEPEPKPRPGRRARAGTAVRWSALVLGVLAIFLVLGVLQGLNTRRVNARNDAISHFATGTTLLESGDYELAIANFNEALRLQPEFSAAQQMLALAESRLDQSRITPTVVPTATLSSDEAAEERFAEGAQALADEEWLLAISIFEGLRQDAPDYRADEVEEALFTALREAAQEAFEDEEPEQALELLEQALALRDDQPALEELRDQLTLYLDGRAALEDEAWDEAQELLRALYLANPEFRDTASLLADATLGQARVFEEDAEWCDAADSYRIALRYEQTAGTQQRLEEVLDACNTGVAPVASANLTPSTGIGGSGTVTSTIRLTPTPITSTMFITPTRTPVFTPTATIPVASSPLPPAGDAFFVLQGGVTVLDNCRSNTLVGIIRAANGAPQPGVTVQVTDPNGNVRTDTSAPNGVYEIPLSDQVARYDILLFVNGERASTLAYVTQPIGTLNCFQLNWLGS